LRLGNEGSDLTRTLKWEKGRFEERVMGIGIDA